jgi:hypothetical protein
MYIYVSFNGMTRMRTIGLLGITAVIVGFVLVVWKIVRGRGFVWLINRQLWTPAAAIFLYAVLPVDFLVHTYNVRRILKGDLAPSVQISVHPIDSGGILALYPLMKSNDEAIREGIKAMLAERALRAEYIERDIGFHAISSSSGQPQSSIRFTALPISQGDHGYSSSRAIHSRIYGGQLRSAIPFPSRARRNRTTSRSTRTTSLRSSTRVRPGASAARSADSSLTLFASRRPLTVNTTSPFALRWTFSIDPRCLTRSNCEASSTRCI